MFTRDKGALNSKIPIMETARCWICSVSFGTDRQYLRHLSTKRHVDMEDMQKGAYAVDLEVPVEMEEQCIQSGIQDPVRIPQADAPASLVLGSSETNIEGMEFTSVQSPVSSPLTLTEDPASLQTDDDSEDDGE